MCVCCSAGVRKNGTLTFMLSDHLGSTSLTTDSAGNVISELRYTAWGEVRYQAGTTSTSYTYTGQYSNTADFGLMFYNARWYDPSLGRFAQADSIVPGGVQGYDRYAYVQNNPLRYTDPSGHRNCEEDGYNCPGNDKLSITLAKELNKWKGYTPSNIVTCYWGPTCVRELMGRAMVHEKDSVLSGRGLEVLQNDQRLLDLQDEIVDSIKTDPRYGIEDFNKHRNQEPVTFGDEGHMDALYSQTWSVRAVNIDVDIHAAKSGEIYINYEFTDVLDLRPDWTNEARTKSGYNRWVSVLGFGWHDFLGASDQMTVYAHWMTVVR